jgi:spermidine synthase
MTLPLSAALVGIGFTSLMLQVVLARELVVSFLGNELIIGIILLSWMLLVAAGSGIGGRLLQRRSTAGLLAGLQVLMAPLMIGGLALARAAGQQGEFAGEIASPAAAMRLTVAALAPACVVLGMQFAVGCHVLGRLRQQGASQVYLLEAGGAVAAGALFHFIVADHLNATVAVLALGAVNCALAGWLACHRGQSPKVTVPPSGIAVVAGLGAVVCVSLVGWPGMGLRLDRELLGLRWGQELVAWRNTRYGMWSVTRQRDQLTYSHDGLPVFSTGPEPAAEAVHLALAAHPDPQRVLMIGGGPLAIGEALKHPLRQLDYVELDRRGIEFVREHLPAELARPLDDARVRLQFTDGRAFVKAAEAAYDVIAADLPDPTTAVINRYYTEEFFAEAARALKPGGLLFTGLASPRVTLTGERGVNIGGVWRALSGEFERRALLPVGEKLHFLAGDGTVEFPEAEELGERLVQRGVHTRFLTPFTLSAELNPLACELARQSVAEVSRAPINSDFRPVAYYLQMRLWVRQFAPRAELGWLDAIGTGRLGWVPWALVGLLGAGALTLGRRWQGYGGAAVAVAILLVGLLEMGVQLAVIFGFQTIAGYLYHQIGLLMTLNMLGLAVGAWAGRRIPRTAASGWLLATITVFVGLCAALPWVMRAAAAAPTLATPILGAAALVASVLTGAAFPLGVVLSEGSEARSGAALYALDLVGGAAGAALISILLVPLRGLDASAWTLAVLGIAALVACFPLARRRGVRATNG